MVFPPPFDLSFSLHLWPVDGIMPTFEVFILPVFPPKEAPGTPRPFGINTPTGETDNPLHSKALLFLFSPLESGDGPGNFSCSVWECVLEI